LIGCELAPAAPASAVLTLIVRNDKKDRIEIVKGDQFCTKGSEPEKSITFEYVGDNLLIIDLDSLKKNSFEEGFKKYVGIPVQEGKTIGIKKDEIDKLGVSDGYPNQRFKLSKPKMIDRTLKIQAKTNIKTEDWELRSSLIFSKGDEKHYFIQSDENDMTTICFGDGLFGKIPEKGSEIDAIYRIGGGIAGNVGANKITVVSKTPQLQALGAKVTNELPASGGAEREPIEHAIKFAPKVFRSLDRAVTEKDFENLALSYPGVAKVRALSKGWNKVSLCIVPEGKTCQKPEQVLKKDIMDFFEDKRMVGTFVDIQDPLCVPFAVWLKVRVAHNYLKVDIKKRVEESVIGLFKVDNVDFGRSMYLSKVYEIVESLEGVDSVFVSLFNRIDHLEFKDGMKAHEMPLNELSLRFSPPKPEVDLDTYLKNILNNPIAEGGIVSMSPSEIPTISDEQLLVLPEDGLMKAPEVADEI
jgi:hypothetical protein